MLKNVPTSTMAVLRLTMVVVQLLSRVLLFDTPWTAACQASLSLSPRVCSNSCPLNRWCHPTISSSVIHFSSSLQSFPASGSFPMSRLSMAKVSEFQHQSFQWIFRFWFPLGWTGLISLLTKGLSRVFSSTTWMASILQHSVLFMVQLSHSYMTTGKTIALTIWTSVSKMMSLLFNTLCRFVIVFLPRSKHLLISRLQ